MIKTILTLLAIALLVSAGQAADVTTPIHQFIDGFNTGDVNSAYAAYANGDVVIVDEFPPHLWIGPHAAQNWAADYEKYAKAEGVSDGSVKYGKPVRTEVEGNVAYVVIPTVYTYKDHGNAMTEEGQMTFALRMENDAWKIAAWTWTGGKAHH